MPQDNNIQQKLQQLENQQLPDLSQMDKHWESMQALLQPAVVAGKPIISVSKIFYTSVGIVTLVAAIFFFQKNNHSNRGQVVNSGPIAGNDTIASAKDQHVDSANNSSVSNFNVNSLHLKPQLTFTPILNDIYLSTGDTLAAEDIFKESTFMEDENIQGQLLLTDLFKSLSKPAELFSIDNKKDTLLLCKEGTVVLVPANTFAGEDSVDFEITEFYEYSDMVLNRLATMSDTNQLISGGMLRINAYRNDSLIDVKLNKSLKVFVPGITQEDSMQIFDGNKYLTGDSVAADAINWKLTDTKINSSATMTIWAINLVDYEYSKLTFDKKTKGVFRKAYASQLNRQELLERMKIRYPKYDKIVIKRTKKRKARRFKNKIKIENKAWWESRSGIDAMGWAAFQGIGSRLGFKEEEIRLHSLTPIDTSYDVPGNSFFGSYNVARGQWDRIKGKYNIDINELGWYNCDRFYKNPGPKADLSVQAADKSGRYYTVMVFDKFKSVVSGYLQADNSMLFSKIPVGEAVKIVSIGVNQQGRSVIAIKELTIGRENELIQLDYEEQGENEIKNSLSILNK